MIINKVDSLASIVTRRVKHIWKVEQLENFDCWIDFLFWICTEVISVSSM